MADTPASSSRLPVVISAMALLISCVTLYVNHFRNVDLDVAISRDVYISNTLGGIPDANLSITLWANGPSTNAIAVGSVRMILRNLDTDTTHTLVNNPRDVNNPLETVFPAIVTGGSIATYNLLFQVDEYIPVRIDRYNAWSDALARAFPDQTTLVESIRSRLIEDFVPVDRGTAPDGDTPSTSAAGALAALLSGNVSDQADDLNQDVWSLLQDAPVEQLRQLVFFTSGRYEVEVSVLDPLGNVLETQRRSFSIEDVVSQTLRYRFNVNTRVSTVSID